MVLSRAGGREADEQREPLRIRVDRVRAGAPVTGQVFAQKGAQMAGKRCHRAPRSRRASPHSAICCSRKGVASRYQ